MKNKTPPKVIRNPNTLTFFEATIPLSHQDLPWLKESPQSTEYLDFFNQDNFDKAAFFSQKSNDSSLSLLGTASLQENYQKNATECERAIYTACLKNQNAKFENSDNRQNHYSDGNKNTLHKASQNQVPCNSEIEDIEKWMNETNLALSTKGATH